MKLRLMTPEGTLFQGGVTSVHGRAPGGEFEILPGHGAWVSSINPCCLTVAVSDDRAAKPLSFAVHGGLIEVLPRPHGDSVLILADTAEAAGEISNERAARARARAEGYLKKRAPQAPEGAQGVDIERARRALARALARLEAYTAGQ